MKRVVAVLIVLWMVLTAAPAQAADGLNVRTVDTTAFPDVNMVAVRPSGGVGQAAVTENGKQVPSVTRTMAEANVAAGVVLVIDTSSDMNSGFALDKVKAAAVAMVRAKAPNEQYAVVAVNSGARPVVNFTGDAELLAAGINGLTANGDNALWRGVQLGSSLVRSAPQLQGNMVVISGSPDNVSPAGTYTNALAEASSSNLIVNTVGLTERRDPNSANLSDLAAKTDGRYAGINFDAVGPTLAGIGRTISSQAVVSYRSGASGALDLTVNLDGASAALRTSPGMLSQGDQVRPAATEASSVPPFVRGNGVLIAVGLLTLIGVAVLLYAFIELSLKSRKELATALRPYSDTPDEKTDVTRLADSEIIRRAIDRTAQVAAERGVLEKVRLRLEQADLPLKPAEAIFFNLVSLVVAMFLGATLFGFLGFVAFAALFGAGPVAYVTMRARRRRAKFTSQLPDTLQLLAGSLRAGYSLVQGMDAVAKQTEMPMAGELQRAMNEARLGRPIEDALQEVSDRMGSGDFEWTVMAIKIQREVGGNLAELLMTVSETMINRERLRREVKALTAEGRISAVVLSLLPPAIGAVIAVVNPAYLDPLIGNFIGQAALVGAGFMIVAGYLTMRKLCEVEA